MKRIFKYFAAVLMILFSGCEQEELLDLGNDYKELLIVQSQIFNGVIFPGVRLTKSLPIGTEYDIKKAEINDALLYIRIDGKQIVPLHYTSQGIYKTKYEIIPIGGQTFELFGERGEQTFYSKTIIPYVPVVRSAKYIPTEGYSEAVIYANPGEVYSAVWVVRSSQIFTAKEFFNTAVPLKDGQVWSALVRTSTYPVEYRDEAYAFNRFLSIYAFDEAFHRYFKTKSAGEITDNPYTQGSGQTEWNVRGNRVIGLFIGIAMTEQINAAVN